MIDEMLKPQFMLPRKYVGSREAAINRMLSAVYKSSEEDEKRKSLRSILKRERILSSEIGGGIYFPHTRKKNLDKARLSILTPKNRIEPKFPQDPPLKFMLLLIYPGNNQLPYRYLIHFLGYLIRNQATLNELVLSSGETKFYDKLLDLEDSFIRTTSRKMTNEMADHS